MRLPCTNGAPEPRGRAGVPARSILARSSGNGAADEGVRAPVHEQWPRGGTRFGSQSKVQESPTLRPRQDGGKRLEGAMVELRQRG